jgi:hypothetical protein
MPANPEMLEEMLGPRVDISGITSKTKINQIDELVFELYKEAIAVLGVTSHILDESAATKDGFPRNQAICAGLMIRIGKFMIAVAQLSAKDNRREVVHSLNRSIMESAVNLEFLVRTKEDKYFDEFVELSLGPERELYDLIQANIAGRQGEVWPMEQRMLEAINNLCSASGMQIEEVDRKSRNWGGNLRERLKALKKEEQYVIMQRLPSHAVHGTWVDLVLHHLERIEKTNMFRPQPTWSTVDARLLGPIAVGVLNAVEPYVERFFSALPESRLLLERIDNLRNRTLEMDDAHEKLLNAASEQGRGP